MLQVYNSLNQMNIMRRFSIIINCSKQIMSIIQVDKEPLAKALNQNKKLTWQQRFRKRLYVQNYAKYFKREEEQDIFLEDQKSQSAYRLSNMIKEDKLQPVPLYGRNEYYDDQICEDFYSPYSVFIPLEDQSYMNNELANTFSFLNDLKDRSKQADIREHEQQISALFLGGKTKGSSFIRDQWAAVKAKYFCNFDSVKAVSILIEASRTNWQAMHDLFKRHGQSCLKEVFYFKVRRASMYLRPSLKIYQNLKMSVEVGDEISERTLPMVMKTWYCCLCMSYDCQKHRLEEEVTKRDCQYISEANKKSQSEHIQHILKLLQIYQQLKNGDAMSPEEQNREKACSSECFYLLSTKEIPRVYRNKFKLVSPLVKSLLQMGIQIFSYNPCQIHHLFQSSSDNNAINCNLIFIHFTEERDLPALIGLKMYRSESEYLRDQSGKLTNPIIKSAAGPIKSKKTQYQEKRHRNNYTEFPTCKHIFIGEAPIDAKCENCVCKARGFCLPSCLCTDSCSIKRVSCNCRGLDSCQTEKCLCFTSKMECQPGVCGECFAGKHQKRNSCRNDQILRHLSRRVFIGVSQVQGAGLGAFAGESFNKHDLVCKYSGEHISSEMDSIREMMIHDLSFYNFDSPNGKSIRASIDARIMGNKARFINHANDGRENLRADTIFSNGTQYIALFASRDIQEGSELFFNYDGTGQLYLQHREKYPFILPPKKT